MVIYYVDMPYGCKDLNCAWSNFGNAVHYLSEEAKTNNWTVIYIKSTDETSYFYCELGIDNRPLGTAKIYPIFLDEKPYFYPNEN